MLRTALEISLGQNWSQVSWGGGGGESYVDRSLVEDNHFISLRDGRRL